MYSANGFVGRDDKRRFGIRRQTVAAFARSARKMNAHDPFGCVVLGEQMPRRVFDLRCFGRHRNFQEVGAALEAFEMFVPEKRLSVRNSNRFEQAIAVEKAAIVDRQRGAFERDVLAVNVGEHAQLLVTRWRFDQSIWYWISLLKPLTSSLSVKARRSRTKCALIFVEPRKTTPPRLLKFS